MAELSNERHLLGCFAELLNYPRPGLADVARQCEEVAAELGPAVAEQVRALRVFIAETPLARLEELYTGAFDLDATCHPYVGYHLFGESYKRSVFLLELKQRYAAAGYTIGSELPDHLAVLLRFAAGSEEDDVVAELVTEAILPALDRMTGKAKSAGYDEESAAPEEEPRERHPYREALEALRLALQARHTAVSYESLAVATSPNVDGCALG